MVQNFELLSNMPAHHGDNRTTIFQWFDNKYQFFFSYQSINFQISILKKLKNYQLFIVIECEILAPRQQSK